MNEAQTIGGGEWTPKSCGNCGEYNLGTCVFWGRRCSARGKACGRWTLKDQRTDDKKRTAT